MQGDSICRFVEIVHATERDAVLDLDRPLVVQVVALLVDVDNFLVVSNLVSVMCLGGLFFALLIQLALLLGLDQAAGLVGVYKQLADLLQYPVRFHAVSIIARRLMGVSPLGS